MHKRTRHNRGFTLIELMVVIVILGIIGTMAFVFVLRNPDEARWTKAQTEMAEIVKALNTYHLKNGGTYPQSLDDVGEQFNGKVPMNPFNKQPYTFEVSNNGFTLTCLGKDDAPGGEKIPDKDIVFTERGLQDDSK
ncbi:MAG: prepilin-type N-terminal cleavage/methylation domain-containing protein [Planctomycetes bacterium]|nr:prepilin-type N-terminal cleavage/methylation domain-containing protein [Planctomycetota bacterium]